MFEWIEELMEATGCDWETAAESQDVFFCLIHPDIISFFFPLYRTAKAAGGQSVFFCFAPKPCTAPYCSDADPYDWGM